MADTSLGRRRATGVLISLTLALASCSTGEAPAPPPPATIVFRGGPILTMTDSGTVAALAVRDGTIVAVGTEEQVAPHIGAATRVIELGGRALLPGFVDPHTHLLSDADIPILEAQQLALENGITTLADASVEPELLDDFLAAKDGLAIRVGLYLGRTTYCGDDLGTWYEEHAPRTTFGDRLFVAGVKIFSDGGACRNAAASRPPVDGYDTEPPFFEPAILEQMVRTADTAGYQVLIHAQGDLAIRDAQDAIAGVLGGGPNILRHRIDHNSIVTPDLRPRYGEIGIVPVIFGTFPTCADIPWTPFWMDNGEDWRSLVDANPGLRIAWHGDDPWATPISPLHDLASYVTRADRADDGSLCQPPAWLADNALRVEEALPMLNVNSAYALGLDDVVGSLAPGRVADLVVVTADPLTTAATELFDLGVVATVVDGVIVYCRAGDEGLCG